MKVCRVIMAICFTSLICFNIASIYHSQISLRRVKKLGLPEAKIIANIGISLLEEIRKLNPDNRAKVLTYFLIGVGKLEEALQSAQGIRNEMRRREALESIARACGEIGPEYLSMLETTLQSAQGIKYKDDRRVVLQSIAEACGEIGPESLRILEATLQSAQGIGYEEWRRDALQSIADACVKIGPESLSILEKTLQSAQDIGDEYYRSEALQSIALAYYNIGKKGHSLSILEAALQSAQGIGEKWDRSRALQSIAEACGVIGPESLRVLEATLQSAQGIEDEKYRSEVLQFIAEACGEIGPESLSILEVTFQSAQGIEDEKYRSEVLQFIAEACGNIGPESLSILEAVLRSAQDINDYHEVIDNFGEFWPEYKGYCSKILRSIALAYYKIEKKEQSLRILEAVLQSAQSISNEHYRSEALQSIAEACGEIGPESLRVLEATLQSVQGIMDIKYEDDRSEALQSIAEACGEIGPKSLSILKGVLQSAQDMSEDYRSEVFQSIAKACEKIGPESLSILKAALQSVQDIEDKKSRSEALQSIALAYYKIGEKGQSLKILEAALQSAQGIGYELYRMEAFQSIAEACGEIGPESLSILEATLQSAQGIVDEHDRSEALQSIAEVCGKIGLKSLRILEIALQSAQGIKHEGYRWGVLRFIAKAWINVVNNYIPPFLIDSYQNDTLPPKGGILLGAILGKEEIYSIAKNDYDKALMYYGYYLPLVTSDPQILDWAKCTFNAEDNVETKKVLLDLIGLLAEKKDFKALGFLEGKVRNKILNLNRNLKQKPLTEVELHLLRVLSEINQRTLVPLILREDVPLNIREEFVQRLAEKDTIDEGLSKVIKDAKETGRVEEFFTYLTQLYEEFKIIAPAKLIEELLKGKLTMTDLRQYIPKIEGAGFEELIGLLKQDEKARLAYYCLKQPKLRYSVGAYPYERFSKAIDEVPYPIEEANDPSVLEKLKQALVRQVGKEQAEFIISQIKQGKAPLIKGSKFLDEEGKFIPQEVSLEYLNQIRQDMEELLETTYRGLVALLKLNYVVKELRIEIEEITTSAAIEQKLNELLEEHPELTKGAGAYLAELTKKMKSDKLLGALLQVTDPRSIKSLAEVKEPDLDKFLGYLKKKEIKLEEVLDRLEEELAETLKPTYGHLRNGFENLIRLSKERAEVEGRLGARRVYIRYAEKDDLISFLRFADGAQCCITSSSPTGGENRRYFKYVPYALTDYMSHVFVLVDEKDNQVGYILTHYGIEEGGELVLLSLQAYIREGYYTEEGLKNIWEVMSKVAKDMGVREILQSKVGYNLGRDPKWLPKERIRVKKLQSVRSHNLPDDLNLPMNEYEEDEFYVIEIKGE